MGVYTSHVQEDIHPLPLFTSKNSNFYISSLKHKFTWVISSPTLPAQITQDQNLASPTVAHVFPLAGPDCLHSSGHRCGQRAQPRRDSHTAFIVMPTGVRGSFSGLFPRAGGSLYINSQVVSLLDQASSLESVGLPPLRTRCTPTRCALAGGRAWAAGCTAKRRLGARPRFCHGFSQQRAGLGLLAILLAVKD